MKTYTITVNGVAYEVTVQEGTGAPQVALTPAQFRPAPTQHQLLHHTSSCTSTKPAPAPAGSQGSIEVESPMPGKSSLQYK